jgi:hypothetical protein
VGLRQSIGNYSENNNMPGKFFIPKNRFKADVHQNKAILHPKIAIISGYPHRQRNIEPNNTHF